jgi:hypothetical protein
LTFNVASLKFITDEAVTKFTCHFDEPLDDTRGKLREEKSYILHGERFLASLEMTLPDGFWDSLI